MGRRLLSELHRRLPVFLARLRAERRTFVMEVYLAVQACFVGAWLLMPWSTFSTIPEVYAPLAVVMPEWAWGTIFAAHGCWHLRALDRDDMRTRRVMIPALIFLWLIAVMSFLLTAPLSLAVPVYCMPIVGGLWVNYAHGLVGKGGGTV
jgi:hypothetical protein